WSPVIDRRSPSDHELEHVLVCPAARTPANRDTARRMAPASSRPGSPTPQGGSGHMTSPHDTKCPQPQPTTPHTAGSGQLTSPHDTKWPQPSAAGATAHQLSPGLERM